jgi:hypothetical protein
MSVSPSLSILSVLVARVSNKSIVVPITLLSGDRISHFDMVRISVSTLCKAHSQPLQSLYGLLARRDISSSLVYN